MRTGLAIAAVALLVGILLAVPLWRALERNLLALQVEQNVRLIRDTGDCPELAVAHPVPSASAPTDPPGSPILYLRGIQALAENKPAQGYALLASSSGREQVDYLWLGCAALRNGETAQAAQAWQEGESTPYFLNHADYAFNEGKYAVALRLYQRAAQLRPNSIEAWIGMTGAFQNLAGMGRADWQSMLDSAERALSLAPQNPQAHYFVGYALWLLGRDPARAEAELRWALAHRDYWADAYALGRMLLDRGDAGEPTRLLERALKLNDLPQIRGQLVRAFLAEGRCEDASGAAAAARAKFPQLASELEQICARYPSCQCG